MRLNVPSNGMYCRSDTQTDAGRVSPWPAILMCQCASWQCSTAQLEDCRVLCCTCPFSSPAPVLMTFTSAILRFHFFRIFPDAQSGWVRWSVGTRKLGGSGLPFRKVRKIERTGLVGDSKSLHRGPRPQGRAGHGVPRATGGSCFCKMNRSI
jgi:hypothetical protein